MQQDDKKNANAMKNSWEKTLIPQRLCPHCELPLSYSDTSPMERTDHVKEFLAEFDQANKLMIAKILNKEVEGEARTRAMPQGYTCRHCGIWPLSVSRQTWRLPFGHFGEADKANLQLRNQVLTRDNFTCMDCGLRLNTHMEVRHLDEDHYNNTPSNLRCVCPFCAMRDHLGPTGIMQAATVIAHPRLNQRMINAFTLIAWFVIDTVPEDRDIRVKHEGLPPTATLLRSAAISTLESLQTTIGSRWTNHTTPVASNPFAFGKVLMALRYQTGEHDDKGNALIAEEAQYQSEAYKARSKTLAGFMLMPRASAFKKQRKDWFETFSKHIPILGWEVVFQNFIQSIGMDDAKDFFNLVIAYNALQSTSSEKAIEALKSSIAPPAPAAETAPPEAPSDIEQKPQNTETAQSKEADSETPDASAASDDDSQINDATYTESWVDESLGDIDEDPFKDDSKGEF